MTLCTLILQFKSDPTGPAFDLVSRLPIVIGTVPLHAGKHVYARGDSLIAEKVLFKAEDETACDVTINVEDSDTYKTSQICELSLLSC